MTNTWIISKFSISAYKFMAEGNLIEACTLLELETDFDKSLYQLVRTEFIIAKYYEGLDMDHIPTDYHGRDGSHRHGRRAL